MSDIVLTYGKYLRVGYERPKEKKEKEREHSCETPRRSYVSTSRRYTLADLFHGTLQVLTMRAHSRAYSPSLSLRYA